ncbi:PREDICTED: poly(U)-specific endoribonuclease isoform X2 [Chinchilla lanigera]|uniref:poly(U)-specific endoribonuclease isoform X2 n=1 Tax=Chinchilla lanigera TaxID=34839 RepID=UPI000696DB50|nr:PREDICTED: poly(U)-specific endoribonuclease isoform X2 [Chinchilla lanigera]
MQATTAGVAQPVLSPLGGDGGSQGTGGELAELSSGDQALVSQESEALSSLLTAPCWCFGQTSTSQRPTAVLRLEGNLESCASRCAEKFDRDAVCQCDRRCPVHGDCCDDYEQLCAVEEDPAEPASSPEVEEEPPTRSLYAAPSSCRGRCREAFDRHDACHCNDRCREFGNCCVDFESLCGGFSHSSDTITKEELQSISEKIYAVDTNKARKEDIILNPQNCIPPSETRDRVDRCPELLFTYVNEKLFSKPTYAAFIKLLNNYQRATGHSERLGAQELAEQDAFLGEIMKTAVMKELYGFLHHQNRYSSEPEFVDDLKNMWFGLYSRGSEQGDSSGFEHVFSGEVKKGKVTGFHNWIRFYLQEKEGLVDYYSHIYDGPWDSYPDVLAMQFSWDGYYKEVGSAFIGSSPEFEFALYSLCFIARPGRTCQLSLGGYPLSIQTYAWDKTTYGNGRKYIATAYIVSSTQ